MHLLPATAKLSPGVPPVTPVCGNGMRVFIALRQLNLLKPDDVVYRMVIKSLVKRKKRVSDTVPSDAGPSSAEDKDVERYRYFFAFLSCHALTVVCCGVVCCAVLCCEMSTLHVF